MRIRRAVIALESIPSAAAIALCAFVGIGCESTGRAPGHGDSTPPGEHVVGGARVEPATPDRFDPLQGDYPQLSWMINISELEGPIVLDRSGEIFPAPDPARARAESAVFAEAQQPMVFESLQGARGHRAVSAPFVMSRPGQRAEIGIGTRDKARASSGAYSTAVTGAVDGDWVQADITWRNDGASDGAPWHGIADARIPAGGGVVLIAPVEGRTSASGRPIWSVVVVRPTILRSVDDDPFQTSASLTQGR